MKTLGLLLLFALVPTGLATHPSKRIELKRNLDNDRALERIVGVEDVTSDHSVWRANVRVVDRCAGRTRTLFVARGYQRLTTVTAVNADDRGRLEIFAALSGLRFNQGEARLVRLTSRRQGCPTLRTLFRYVAAETERPPIPELELTQFQVDVAELESQYAGRELRVTELFHTPQMLSSVHRETLYRYVRSRDAYVAYATNTHRVP